MLSTQNNQFDKHQLSFHLNGNQQKPNDNSGMKLVLQKSHSNKQLSSHAKTMNNTPVQITIQGQNNQKKFNISLFKVDKTSESPQPSHKNGLENNELDNYIIRRNKRLSRIKSCVITFSYHTKNNNTIGEVQQQSKHFILDLQSNKDLKILKQILSQNQKDELQMAMVKRSLISQLKFFQEIFQHLPKAQQEQVLLCLQLENYKIQHVLFKFGDIGDKFYIVLKGSVYVLMKQITDQILQQNEEQQKQQQQQNTNKQQTISRQIIIKNKQQTIKQFRHYSLINQLIKTTRQLGKRKHSNDQSNQEDDDNDDEGDGGGSGNSPNNNRFQNASGQRILTQAEIKKAYPNLVVVGQINQGESFGEYALIKDLRRSATIVTREDSVFLSINKKNFVKLLGPYFEKTMKEKINFLKRLKFFEEIENKLGQFFVCFETKHFTHSEVIYKENDDTNYLYLIHHGDIEISQDQTPKKNEIQSTPQNQNYCRGKIQLAEFKNEIADLNSLASSITFDQNIGAFLSKENTSLIKTTQEIPKKFILSILTSGQYFGEEEIVDKIPKRRFQAKVLSQIAELICISKKNLAVITKNTDIMNLLKQLSAAKHQWRQSYTQNYEDTKKLLQYQQMSISSVQRQRNDKNILTNINDNNMVTRSGPKNSVQINQKANTEAAITTSSLTNRQNISINLYESFVNQQFNIRKKSTVDPKQNYSQPKSENKERIQQQLQPQRPLTVVNSNMNEIQINNNGKNIGSIQFNESIKIKQTGMAQAILKSKNKNTEMIQPVESSNKKDTGTIQYTENNQKMAKIKQSSKSSNNRYNNGEIEQLSNQIVPFSCHSNYVGAQMYNEQRESSDMNQSQKKKQSPLIHKNYNNFNYFVIFSQLNNDEKMKKQAKIKYIRNSMNLQQFDEILCSLQRDVKNVQKVQNSSSRNNTSMVTHQNNTANTARASSRISNRSWDTRRLMTDVRNSLENNMLDDEEAKQQYKHFKKLNKVLKLTDLFPKKNNYANHNYLHKQRLNQPCDQSENQQQQPFITTSELKTDSDYYRMSKKIKLQIQKKISFINQQKYSSRQSEGCDHNFNFQLGIQQYKSNIMQEDN